MTLPPPAHSLPIAVGLSILVHAAALITWPLPPGPGGAIGTSRQLDVRFGHAQHAVEAAPRPQPGAHTITAATSPVQASSKPAPVIPAASSPSTEPQPLPIFPVEALTRLPTLVTEITSDDWPSTPGAPSGSFRIEVDVGPDGRVMHVKSECEPRICEAAATYAGTITGWRFTPAEILGHRVSSRIHIEFEIGSPEGEGFITTPVPPQMPPRQ